MREDVLNAIPTSLALSTLDSILSILTHRSSLIRRSAYTFLVLSSLATWYSLFTLHAQDKRHQDSLVQLERIRVQAASIYVPSPPTRDQRLEFERLGRVVGDTRSAYDRTEPFTGLAVTAVLVYTGRSSSFGLMLKLVAKYPFVREIIVWNDDPTVDLGTKDLLFHGPSSTPAPKLRIYNSPASIENAAKYFACSLATNEHCYFNDDAWLNLYMDSLYATYLECCVAPPGSLAVGRIASIASSVNHLRDRKWRFESADIEMHAGHMGTEAGAFVPRRAAKRFIEQQTAIFAGLNQSQAAMADLYFSLWSNTYHEQIIAQLLPLDVEDSVPTLSSIRITQSQTTALRSTILDAVIRLSDVLTLEPYLSPHPFSTSLLPPDPLVRAACAGDACIFITCVSPFASPASLVYPDALPEISGRKSKKKKKDRKGHEMVATPIGARFDPGSWKNLEEQEARWEKVVGGWPEEDWWKTTGSWERAVDGRGKETCWESWRAFRVYDHFGVRLVASKAVSYVTVIGSEDLGEIHVGTEALPTDKWTLWTLAPGNTELDRRVVVNKRVNKIDASLVEITLELQPLPSPAGAGQLVQQIKFVSTGVLDTKTRVCGFDISGLKV